MEGFYRPAMTKKMGGEYVTDWKVGSLSAARQAPSVGKDKMDRK